MNFEYHSIISKDVFSLKSPERSQQCLQFIESNLFTSFFVADSFPL